MIEITPLIILLFVFLIFFGPAIMRLSQQKRQQRHFRQIAQQISILYQDINPYQLSMKARNLTDNKDKNMVYGEVEILTLLYLLSSLDLPKEAIFYDLGSGCGKQVIAAKLAFALKKSIGIEYLKELYTVSLEITQKLELTDDQVEFIHKSFFETDFSDADCILVNATCLEPTLWKQLNQKLLMLKSGCYVIVITKRISQAEQFKLLSENMELMSWGYATTRIYQRI